MFLMFDHGELVTVLTDSGMADVLLHATLEFPKARIAIGRDLATIGRIDTTDHDCFIFRKVPYYGDN